jgi:hypothetical protein
VVVNLLRDPLPVRRRHDSVWLRPTLDSSKVDSLQCNLESHPGPPRKAKCIVQDEYSQQRVHTKVFFVLGGIPKPELPDWFIADQAVVLVQMEYNLKVRGIPDVPQLVSPDLAPCSPSSYVILPSILNMIQLLPLALALNAGY